MKITVTPTLRAPISPEAQGGQLSGQHKCSHQSMPLEEGKQKYAE